MDEVVQIGKLKVGERFALIDRSFTITGTVKIQSKGYTSVRIDGTDRTVNIGDRTFEAKGTSTAEWSSSTAVYRLKEEEDTMDSVPIDSAALSGSGEPIPLPRQVPTPAQAATPKPKKEKIMSEPKTKIKNDAKAQERIKLAELRNKEKAAKAKAQAGPNGGKAEKTIKKCRCGCGGDTKGMFAPGHDARFYGWAKKIVAGVPFDKLKNFTPQAKTELATKAKAEAVLASSGH